VFLCRHGFKTILRRGVQHLSPIDKPLRDQQVFCIEASSLLQGAHDFVRKEKQGISRSSSFLSIRLLRRAYTKVSLQGMPREQESDGIAQSAAVDAGAIELCWDSPIGL